MRITDVNNDPPELLMVQGDFLCLKLVALLVCQQYNCNQSGENLLNDYKTIIKKSS